jgi:hypothetical protein
MRYLFFDLSEKCSAYALIVDGKITSYNSQTMLSKVFGESLYKLYHWIKDVIFKTNPDVIGVEDIFSQSITSYKKLSKLQAIAELICYNYNKETPIFANASAIRKHFGLNIEPVLSEKQFYKKIKKAKKVKYSNYEDYLKDEKHYFNKFKHIDFDTSHYKIIDGEVVDIRKYKKVNISKKGNISVKGSKISSFDYAKKIVIIDYINRLYGFKFTYQDNDLCDALLGCYFLSKGFYLKKKIIKKKGKK